jgi:hypothetical protein
MGTRQSVSGIVDSLGGTFAFARLIGKPPRTVSNWKAAGLFPAKEYVALNTMLAERGVSVPPTLFSMKKPPSVRRAAE